ncbi:MAG: hypothetical protein QXK76_00795 [Candidatus Woesearchaeota archaeon]
MIFYKKGQKLLISVILSLIILFFSITTLNNKTITPTKNLLNQSCPDALFCKDSCDALKERYDPIKNCVDKKKCCVIINPEENPLSNECKGKSVGDYCGNKWPSGKDEPKVCNEYLKCVELCDFCADNPSNEKCKINQNDIIGTKIKSFNSNFRCGCAISECTPTSKHTCIKNFCSTLDKNSGEYYCCNK